MKLAPTARAVLTLGPDMCRQDLMQAVARMRQIARGQAVEVIAREEVCRSVREICGLAPEADISMANVVGWTLWNTANAIRKVVHHACAALVSLPACTVCAMSISLGLSLQRPSAGLYYVLRSVLVVCLVYTHAWLAPF